MPHADDEGELDPLVQPRVVRALKNRPRLVDMGFRKEVLEQMEDQIARRRTTDTLASRASHALVNALKDSAEPAVRSRVRDGLEVTNQTVARKL